MNEIATAEVGIEQAATAPVHPLRAWRRKAGLSLVNVADEVGVSISTLSRIEQGKQRPSWELVAKLKSTTCGAISADDFLFGIECNF